MKIGRIEGPLIGQSREVQEWVVTAKACACGTCEKPIPIFTLAYRQTILEGRRFDRSYTYCRTCAEGVGKSPPKSILLQEEKARKTKNKKKGQHPLFPEG